MRTDDVRKDHRTHHHEEVELNRPYKMVDMASVTIRPDLVKLRTKTIDDSLNLVDEVGEVEVTDKVVD